MATDYLLNLKDADVMQMVYEQDVDLGFNWQHINDQGKLQIDKTQGDKNKILGGSSDFFIDGETGEQVPVSGKKCLFPINGNRSSRFTNNQRFNFNENFDFVEGPYNNLQSLKTQEQNNSIWQSNTQYSELTSMNNPPAERACLSHGTQAISLTNLNQSFANTQLTSPCNTIDNRPLDPMNSYNPSNFGSSFVPSTLYNGNVSQPFTPSPQYSSDSYSPSIDAPSSMFTPMMPSDEGSPMEGGCSSLTSPDNAEPSFRFDQFNNYKYNDRLNHLPPSSLGARNPSMTSLPEPGQSFFELGSRPEVSGYYAENVPGGAAPTTFSHNTNAPFLNPPVNNYPTPPLGSSPPSYPLFYMDKAGEQQMAPTIQKSGITDSCESDSGVSIDRSPKGFSYLNTITNEEFIPTTRDTSVFHMQDIKPFHQINNLTNNNTNGMKKLIKKKSNQPSLPRESRDEKRARELNLPFTLEEIILTPVEDYNEMLARTHLNPGQQALVKDIRRRGKNKVAAQNCRKRKIETISNMEEDVDLLRNRRLHLVEEQKQLEIRQHNLTIQYNTLYQQVFNSFRDETGRPYDPNRFSLDQVDGSVVIVPHLLPNHDVHMGAVQRLNPAMEFEIKMENPL